MGDDREWQKQLMSAALMAAAKTAVQYITNPGSRDEAMNDVKSKLAEVDYPSAARAVSEVIDRVAESAKAALNEAIDSLRENAEDAVELAAEKAQEQLGPSPRRGKGRMFFGILLGIALGFVLLNEDRRNQLMDKLTGASGPIDGGQWQTMASGSGSTDSIVKTPAAEPVSEPVTEAAPVAVSEAPEAEGSAASDIEAGTEGSQNGSEAKSGSKRAKATEPKADA